MRTHFPTARPHWQRTSRLGLVSGAVVVLAGAAILVGWAAGWSGHSMVTPSMGTAAPVGTLVISRPISADAVHVGQILVFHPPGRPNTTYMHRVIAITPGPGGPALRTKGDINGSADGWVLHQTNLIGQAVVFIPDGGFVIQELPLFLLGLFVMLLLTSAARRATRVSLRIGGAALLCSALIIYYRPLERISLISQVISNGNGEATVVPAGVLPLRVRAVGGSRLNLTPGQAGTVKIHDVHHNGVFQISSSVHLTGWWWLLILAWVTPILVALLFEREPAASSAPAGAANPPPAHGTGAAPAHQPREVCLVAAMTEQPAGPLHDRPDDRGEVRR